MTSRSDLSPSACAGDNRDMSESIPRGGEPRPKVCARCGAPFDCGMAGDCWCAAEPYRLPMTNAESEDCLCPDCLRREAARAAAAAR